jgi:predicted ATPase
MSPVSRLPVRTVTLAPDAPGPQDGWPWDLPVVARLRASPLDLGALTVLVGANGSGKSTLLEGIALAAGMSPEGGSVNARHSTRRTESELSRFLRISRGPGAPRWGFFLRGETMHGFFTYLEEHAGGDDPVFHEMSHGESFVALVERRFDGPGLYLLDEPESALSFENCLALGAVLHTLAGRHDAQVLLATHSPVLAAIPGARLLELGPAGWTESAWEDLRLVAHWRAFLTDPRRYWRHALD